MTSIKAIINNAVTNVKSYLYITKPVVNAGFPFYRNPATESNSLYLTFPFSMAETVNILSSTAMLYLTFRISSRVM